MKSNNKFVAPKFIDCPNCKTKLELNEGERITRSFICPICNMRGTTVKNLELKVLKYLFEGNQIGGIRFGPAPQLLIDTHFHSKHYFKGQIFINLSSGWGIFSDSSEFPKKENELVKLNEEEEYNKLISIRKLIVTKVELGVNFPHLILYLENDTLFFLSGFDERYEPWDAGVTITENEVFLVVAQPDNTYQTWCPDYVFEQLK